MARERRRACYSCVIRKRECKEYKKDHKRYVVSWRCIDHDSDDEQKEKLRWYVRFSADKKQKESARNRLRQTKTDMNRLRQTEIDRDPQKLPSTTSYYKARTKYVPVLLRTTKLAQSTSQYYFVLQSLHKVLPSTTSYYKACTKYFPVLLRTTKLAQSTSQYYFVLQSLHKVLPSTTSYYKACTKYFPVLLRTTKLAQSTSQSLLRTTKLAQSTSQYYFVLPSLHKVRPITTYLNSFSVFDIRTSLRAKGLRRTL